MILNKCNEHEKFGPPDASTECNYCAQCKTWWHKDTCYSESTRKQVKHDDTSK
jgi:hypothetical protein